MLVAATYLGDIGYAPALARTGFHPTVCRVKAQCGSSKTAVEAVGGETLAVDEALILDGFAAGSRGQVSAALPWPPARASQSGGPGCG